jgi:uncharacterized protein YoxC
MSSIMNNLLEQPHLIALVQVFLDVALIAFFVVVVLRLPRKDQTGEEFKQSLDNILGETQTIAQEFDANLQERRELINQVVATLDQKVNEARQLCQTLEKLKQPLPQVSSGQLSGARDQENHAIFHLAGKGLNATAIAERLQKPLGEIEMVLSLRRLTAEAEV